MTDTIVLSADLIGLIEDYRAKLDALSAADDAGLIRDADWVWDGIREDFWQELQEGICRDDLIDVVSDEFTPDMTDEEFDETFDAVKDTINDILWERVVNSPVQPVSRMWRSGYRLTRFPLLLSPHSGGWMSAPVRP